MRFIDEAVISVKAGDGGNALLVFAVKNLSPKAGLMAVMVARVAMFM